MFRLGELSVYLSCFFFFVFHSDDFVTTFYVGFSNDSQNWAMYSNGYEEMVCINLAHMVMKVPFWNLMG